MPDVRDPYANPYLTTQLDQEAAMQQQMNIGRDRDRAVAGVTDTAATSRKKKETVGRRSSRSSSPRSSHCGPRGNCGVDRIMDFRLW